MSEFPREEAANEFRMAREGELFGSVDHTPVERLLVRNEGWEVLLTEDPAGEPADEERPRLGRWRDRVDRDDIRRINDQIDFLARFTHRPLLPGFPEGEVPSRAGPRATLGLDPTSHDHDPIIDRLKENSHRKRIVPDRQAAGRRSARARVDALMPVGRAAERTELPCIRNHRRVPLV